MDSQDTERQQAIKDYEKEVEVGASRWWNNLDLKILGSGPCWILIVY